MCGREGRQNGSRIMSRQDSSASSIDDLERNDSVPGVIVSDGVHRSRQDELKQQDSKNWLSPPASPNPSINPFFDEHEQKKTHMVLHAAHHCSRLDGVLTGISRRTPSSMLPILRKTIPSCRHQTA
jgi:hypothetical protein